MNRLCRLGLSILYAISLLLSVGCNSGGGVGTSAENNEQMRISPEEGATIAVNGEIELKALLFDEDGEVQPSSRELPLTVSWTSSDSNIVSVDENGLVTGLSAGEATITAKANIPADAATKKLQVQTKITVNPGDVGAILLSPSRVSIDVDGERDFAATAVDTLGSPLKLQCAASTQPNVEHQPTWPQDKEVVTANYSSANNTINVKGVADGFGLMSLTCGGFSSSPVVVGVKQAADIPAQFPVGPNNEGYRTSIVLASESEQHVTVYSEHSKTLTYWQHQSGTWESELIDGNGAYGLSAQMVLDPLNNQNPLICAQNSAALTCWSKNKSGLWNTQTLDEIITQNNAYVGDISIAVSSDDGTIYLAYFDAQAETAKLAVSQSATRSDWVVTTIAHGVSPHLSLALASDNTPRVALQFANKAYYGMSDTSDFSHWVFEPIDADSENSGNSIRLAIGSNHQPQVVYRKDGYLIYRQKINGVWSGSNVGQLDTDSDIAFAIDSRNLPRIIYLGPDSTTLNNAYRYRKDRKGLNDRWRIDQPTNATQFSSYNAIAVDSYGRAHVTFHDAASATLKYYVEPYFFDYSPFDDTEADDIENTEVTNPVVISGLRPRATAGNLQAEIVWDASDQAKSYRIYWYGTDAQNLKPQVINSPTNHLIVPELETGRTYFYAVASILEDSETALSEKLSVTIRPLAPRTFTVIADKNQNTLSWTPVDNVRYYTIYASTHPTINYAAGGIRVDGKLASYTHPNPDNKKLYYAITSSDANTEGLPSLTITAPSTPTGLIATENHSDGSITLKWSPVVGVTGYRVFYGNQTKLTRSAGQSMTVSRAETTLAGLTTDAIYFATVSAVSASGESDLAEPISAKSRRTWTHLTLNTAFLPSEIKQWHAATSNGNHIELLGELSSETAPSAALLFDPAKKDFVDYRPNVHKFLQRRFPGVVAQQDRLYLIGGSTTSESTKGLPEEYQWPSSTIDIYSTAEKAWLKKHPLPVSLMAHQSVLAENGIFILGGQTKSFDSFDCEPHLSSTVFKLDLNTASIAQTHSMPTARAQFSAARIGEKIYALGGITESFCNHEIAGATSTMDALDLVTQKWERKSNLLSWRKNAVALSINGKLYVIGGSDQAGRLINFVETYNPAQNAWEKRSLIPNSPFTPTRGVAVKDKIYLFGTPTNQYLIYDPSADGESSVNAPSIPANTPTEISARLIGNNVSLSWKPSAGTHGYNIYYRTDDMANPVILSTVYTTDFTHVNIQGDKRYFYAISSINDAGESLKSTEVSLQVPLAPPQNLFVISDKWPGPAMSGDNNSGLVYFNQLKWDPVPGAQKYYIWSGYSKETMTLLAETTHGESRYDHFPAPKDYSFQNDLQKTFRGVEYPGTVQLYAISAVGTNTWGSSKISDSVKPLAAPHGNCNDEVPCEEGLSMNAWFSMGDNPHNITEEKVSLLSSTVSGQPSRVQGISASGLSFNGASSIVVPNATRLNFAKNSFTLDAWINISKPTEGNIISKLPRTGTAGGYELALAKGRITLRIGAFQSGDKAYVSNDISQTLADHQWHHIVASLDRSAEGIGTIYLDGVIQYRFSPKAESVDNFEPLTIGQSFVGAIDEVRIYERALTAAEVASIYERGRKIPTYPSGHTVLRWKRSPRAERYNVYYSDAGSLPGYFSKDLGKFLMSTTQPWAELPMAPGVGTRTYAITAVNASSESNYFVYYSTR